MHLITLLLLFRPQKIFFGSILLNFTPLHFNAKVVKTYSPTLLPPGYYHAMDLSRRIETRSLCTATKTEPPNLLPVL